jgi:hypothetical protein
MQPPERLAMFMVMGFVRAVHDSPLCGWHLRSGAVPVVAKRLGPFLGASALSVPIRKGTHWAARRKLKRDTA